MQYSGHGPEKENEKLQDIEVFGRTKEKIPTFALRGLRDWGSGIAGSLGSL